MQTAELIFEQVKTLPESLAREVLDFVGYLKERSERAEINTLMNSQQSSLEKVWQDEADDVWNG